jgi:hypothetical protein
MHLVHFDAEGEAAVLLEGEDAPVLAPGETWTSPRCWTTVPPWGTERLKLIAARSPTAISPWLSGTSLRGDWTRDGTTTTLTYTLTAVAAWAGAQP